MDRSFSRSSRVSRPSDRGTRKDRTARSRSDSSRDRDHRSRSAYRSRLSGRERRRQLRSSDRSRSRSARSRSRGDQSRSSDRSRSRSSDRYRSRRQRFPARRGAHCHAISLVILKDDPLPPLTVRGQRREDGEPDVSGRRVWSRVPKIVDLLLFTALHRQLAPPALDHIGLFLRSKTVFIFLPLLLANCLVPSALSNLKSCTNIPGDIGTSK